MRTKLAASGMMICALAVPGAAGIAAASGGSSTRAEHLYILSTKATSQKLSVIATGAFTASGYDAPARKTDKVIFPDGTFRFSHVSQHQTESFNVSTCLLTETVRGTFVINSGTGAYAGIRGSGTFATRIRAVTAKNRTGQCAHVQAPATFQQVTTANGTVSRTS